MGHCTIKNDMPEKNISSFRDRCENLLANTSSPATSALALSSFCTAFHPYLPSLHRKDVTYIDHAERPMNMHKLKVRTLLRALQKEQATGLIWKKLLYTIHRSGHIIKIYGEAANKHQSEDITGYKTVQWQYCKQRSVYGVDIRNIVLKSNIFSGQLSEVCSLELTSEHWENLSYIQRIRASRLRTMAECSYFDNKCVGTRREKEKKEKIGLRTVTETLNRPDRMWWKTARKLEKKGRH